MGENEEDRTTNTERENRILDAANDLIQHYGYDKTTVSDIAKHAGVSKGAIYLHWKSKEDLFDALVWRELWVFVDDWIAQIEQDDTVISFASMYKHLLGILKKDHPLLLAVLTRNKQVTGTAFLKRNENLFSMRYMLETEFFIQMQQQGVIRKDIDVDTTAYIMTMLAYGFIRVDEVIPSEIAPPLEAVVKEMGDVFDHLLTPPDGGNAEALRQIMGQLMVAYKEKMKEFDIGGL